MVLAKLQCSIGPTLSVAPAPLQEGQDMPPTRSDGREVPQAIRLTHRSITCSTSNGADYSEEEWEFTKWLDRYKKRYKRPFPTCTELLAIIKAMGYRKVEAQVEILPETPHEAAVRVREPRA